MQKNEVKPMKNQHTTQTKTSENDRTSQARATAKSSAAPAMHPMLHLQQQVGNQAVGRLIQAKLTVGEPNDVYEQEADRVAAEVVSQIHAPQVASTGQPASVQRQVLGNEGEELRKKPLIQCKADGGGMAVSSEVESSIQQARGSGQPLAESIRTPMEQAFGADFSGVRVHTDERSDRLNREVQARAFTTGQDVFFRKGEYRPGSRSGQELLAHELTHVVQQNFLSKHESASSSSEGKSREFVTRRNIHYGAPRQFDGGDIKRLLWVAESSENINPALLVNRIILQRTDPLEYRPGLPTELKKGENLHILAHGNPTQFGTYKIAQNLYTEIVSMVPKRILEDGNFNIELHGCHSKNFADKLAELFKNQGIKVTGIPGFYVVSNVGKAYSINLPSTEVGENVWGYIKRINPIYMEGEPNETAINELRETLSTLQTVITKIASQPAWNKKFKPPIFVHQVEEHKYTRGTSTVEPVKHSKSPSLEKDKDLIQSLLGGILIEINKQQERMNNNTKALQNEEPTETMENNNAKVVQNEEPRETMEEVHSSKTSMEQATGHGKRHYETGDIHNDYAYDMGPHSALPQLTIIKEELTKMLENILNENMSMEEAAKNSFPDDKPKTWDIDEMLMEFEDKPVSQQASSFSPTNSSQLQFEEMTSILNNMNAQLDNLVAECKQNRSGKSEQNS
jgi:Domain of unknown function (DUF4157)